MSGVEDARRGVGVEMCIRPAEHRRDSLAAKALSVVVRVDYPSGLGRIQLGRYFPLEIGEADLAHEGPTVPQVDGPIPIALKHPVAEIAQHPVTRLRRGRRRSANAGDHVRRGP